MKKCKFLGSGSLKQNNIYSYYISKIDSSFPYHIYENEDYSPIATFSKSYFDALFVDISEQRKLKLLKLKQNETI